MILLWDYGICLRQKIATLVLCMLLFIFLLLLFFYRYADRTETIEVRYTNNYELWDFREKKLKNCKYEFINK